MIKRNVTIVNRLGLHARAATKLVQAASAHASEVMICRSDKEVNGKSIMGVLMLAASQGTEVTISADGPDEEQALQAICDLVADRFGEAE